MAVIELHLENASVVPTKDTLKQTMIKESAATNVEVMTI